MQTTPSSQERQSFQIAWLLFCHSIDLVYLCSDIHIIDNVERNKI
ncbi:hypothetical protein HMPREF3226_00239 [Prevotella corporis]|uniref:Uncharacterized protein n=1 Tax=Prevotella corporis TaxID=28128 RepID=A0A133QN68_9BACT|nr:hypothetical protein HMPREF3226_00239 [Prevotella corporis]